MTANRGRFPARRSPAWTRAASALAGALPLLLAGAAAAPARADVIVLDDGTELRGQVVVVGSMVQVHQFDGVRSVPRHRIAAMAPRDARPGHEQGLDPDGLFGLALDAEQRGELARAEALRRLAGERELVRRAARLDLGDEDGWTRLVALAAVLGVHPAYVRVLRVEAESGRLQAPAAAQALADAADANEATGDAVEAALDPDEFADDDDPEAELTWRPRRSAARGLSAPVVVIIPGRGRLPEPTCEPSGLIRGVGGRPRTPPTEPRASRPSQPGGETFRAASSGRTTFEALTRQRATTFGAGQAEGHRTARGIGR